MALLDLIILLVVVVVVSYLAYWIIMRFFPEPIRTPALVIAGLLLLLVLFAYFAPGISSYRVWK